MMLTTRYKRIRDQRSCPGPALELTLTRKRARLSCPRPNVRAAPSTESLNVRHP